MPRRARNQEVIRQWTLLRDLWEQRYGRTIEELARMLEVSSRTVRRDIAALQEAGFPLEPCRRGEHRAWRLNRHAFKALIDAGLTLPELCALYFSRALVQYLAGTPFQRDIESAFAKFAECLTPAQWDYLETIPKVLAAKPEPRKRADADAPGRVGRLLRAALERRRVEMEYFSFFSQRLKKYVVEPYQVCYAQGGLYLVAFVPEYQEVRLFATERMQSATVLEERFTPRLDQAAGPLVNSLGVNLNGCPELVEIEFQPDAVPYVLERDWHPSQTFEERDDGRAVLRMRVVVDWGLIAWVLGFGPRARVVKPRRLAARVFELLEEARELYAPPIPMNLPRRSRRGQPALPFSPAD
ncbi:MAG TPA: transcriptional regulator [Vicinamibacterales bacterium]